MSKQPLIFVWVLLTSLSSIRTTDDESRTDVEVSTDEITFRESFERKTHYYDVEVNHSLESKYVRVYLEPKNLTNPVHVYISKETKEPTYSNSEYKSISDETTLLYIDMDSSYSTFTIGVECKTDCRYIFKIVLLDEIQLINNTETEVRAKEVSNNKIAPINVVYYPVEEWDHSIWLTFLGADSDFLTISIQYDNVEIPSSYGFDNGNYAIINKNDFTYQKGSKFNIVINANTEGVITIRCRELPLEGSNSKLSVNSIINVVIGANQLKEECFELYNYADMSSQNTNYSYILNARSFTGNSYVLLKNAETGNEINGKKIGKTDYFLFETDNSASELLCVKTVNNIDQISTIQFQVLNIEDNLNNQPLNMPLIRGTPTKAFLKKGSIMYYRVKNFYVRPKYIQYYMHMTKGYPVLYRGICENTYPNCKFVESDWQDMLKAGKISTSNDVNDNIYLEQDVGSNKDVYNSPYQFIGIVHCPDKGENSLDCEYEITMKNTYDFTFLLESSRISSPINGTTSNIEYYSFNITNPDVKSVTIELYSFSGNADWDVSRDDKFKVIETNYFFAGNKEYYTLVNTAKPGEKNTWLGEYYVRVKGVKSAFYTIFYETKVNDSDNAEWIPSGEMVLETINRQEKKKTFSLVNRNKDMGYTFLVTVSTVNCRVKLSFKGNEYTDRRMQFQIKSDEFGLYNFVVEFVSLDNGSMNELENCMLFFVGNEMAEEREIALNEGVIHSMTLNKDINRINYLYPFGSLIESNTLIISITKFSSLALQVSYGTEKDKLKTIKMWKENTNIVIDKAGANCESRVCSLIVQVQELGNIEDNQEIKFDIEILSSNAIPTYLGHGKTRWNGIFHNTYQYYYSDIGKGQSAEIFVNFKRGSGAAVAKIVQKTEKESNADWNKHVKLPTKAQSNLIPYDYFNRKIVISKDDTQKCVDGCEVYIGIYSYDEVPEKKFNEYSIFMRMSEGVVDIPANEYVFGTINSNENHYYTTTLTKDTDRIIIDFKSELCKGLIRIGNDIPTSTTYDWEFKGDGSMFTINSDDKHLGGKELLGLQLTFRISPTESSGNFDSFYSFKIIIPDKKIDVIIDVNTSQNEDCYIDDNKDRCYFIIPKHSYNVLEEIYLHAISSQISKSYIELFLNTISAEIYDSSTSEMKVDYLPTETKNEKNSVGSFNTDRLFYQKNFEDDIYIIVTVKSKLKGRITFLTSFGVPPMVTNIRPHTKELFYLPPKKSITFNLVGQNINYIEAIALDGTGVVMNTKDSIQNKLVTGSNNSIAMVVMSENDQIKLLIQSSDETAFAFYIKYESRMNWGNFDQIEYGRNNRVQYNVQFFPVSYYVLIEDNSNDIIVNTRLKTWGYTSVSDYKGDMDFELSGIVTDENFVWERKHNEKAKPVGPSADVVYDQGLRSGRFVFDKSILQDSSKNKKTYLYISITPKESNTYNYNKLTLDINTISARSDTNHIALPINEYFFSKLNSNTNMSVLRLQKSKPTDQVVSIEYSNNNNDEYGVTINNILSETQEIDYTKNSTDTIVSDNAKNGKNIITVNMKSVNAVAFTILKKNKIWSASNEANTGANFVLRYQADTKGISYYDIKSSNEMKYDKNNNKDNKYTITFNPVVDDSGANANDVSYTIKWYLATEGKEWRDYNGIYVNDSPQKVFVVESKGKEDLIKYDVEGLSKGNYFVSAIATARYAEQAEILVYKALSINLSDVGGNKNLVQIFIIVGTVLSTIVFLGCVLLIYRCIKSRKNNSLIDNQDFQKINEGLIN